MVNARNPDDDDEPLDKQQPASGNDDEVSPWGMIGFGVFLIALGIGLYFLFAHFEQEGGRVRLPAILIAVYKFLGKGAILGILCVLGAISTFMGISDLRKK